MPLEILVKKFSHTRFEPSGMTSNRDIPFAKSVVDYIVRWLASQFLPKEVQKEVGVVTREEVSEAPEAPKLKVLEGSKGVSGAQFAGGQRYAFKLQEDAPPCHECGSIMIRNGVCYKCVNCGATSGCS